jgi:hypothetical protein
VTKHTSPNIPVIICLLDLDRSDLPSSGYEGWDSVTFEEAKREALFEPIGDYDLIHAFTPADYKSDFGMYSDFSQ